MRYPNNKNRRVDKKMRRFFSIIPLFFIFAFVKYTENPTILIKHMIKKKLLLFVLFTIKCHELFAQQWVWDEIDKEEREPITFGGIVLFAIVAFIIYVLYKIVSTNKTNNNRKNTTYSNISRHPDDDKITHTVNPINDITPSKNVKPTSLDSIEIDGFTISADGSKLLKGKNEEYCCIPDGIKIICRKAFQDAINIKSLIIPNSVEEVEDYAFSSLNIVSVHIPKSIKRIPQYAFEDCKSLSHVSLPDNLEQIGDGAFLGCESLENIELPNTINKIGNGAFQECQRLKSISLPTSLDGLSDCLLMNCFCIEDLVIPEGVVAIGENCFYNCCELRNIQLPSSLLYIENDAFEGCYNLVIKVPCHSELDELYNTHSLGDNCEIIRYDAPQYEKTELDKKKLEKFIIEMKYIRDRDDYEFRKDLGLLTKEEYEKENACHYDIMNDIDD